MTIGPEHTFAATETDMFGVRVSVTITVPAGSTWGPSQHGHSYREVLELAQMAASHCMTSVIKSRTAITEECPF